MQQVAVQEKRTLRTIGDHTVSDLCLQSAPLDRFMQGNDPRIHDKKSRIGSVHYRACRLTMSKQHPVDHRVL